MRTIGFLRPPAAAVRGIGTVVVAVVGIGTIGAGVSGAEPPLRDVAPAARQPASAGLVADGRRVAYLAAASRVRVIDEALEQVASVAEPGCLWRDFGAGALLWSCAPAPPTFPFGSSAIDELGGGQRIALGPPRLPPGGHGETPSWWRIGRVWMTVTYDGTFNAYVNRTTGRVVYGTEELRRARDHVRLITDIDREDLTRPVCAPLVPKTVPGLRGDWNVAPLAYRPPYGATLSGSRLLMGRCGAARLSVLSRCLRSCSDPVVGDRFVAWTEGTSSTRRTLYVRLADRGRTWRWRIRPGQPADRALAAVGRRLFVLTTPMLKTVRLPAAAAR